MDHPPEFLIHRSARTGMSHWEQLRMGRLAMWSFAIEASRWPLGMARAEIAAVGFALHKIMGTAQVICLF